MGVGLHDSSAALIPYLALFRRAFYSDLHGHMVHFAEPV